MPLPEITSDQVTFTYGLEVQERRFFSSTMRAHLYVEANYDDGFIQTRYQLRDCTVRKDVTEEQLRQRIDAADGQRKAVEALNASLRQTYKTFCNRFDLVPRPPDNPNLWRPLPAESMFSLDALSSYFWRRYHHSILVGSFDVPSSQALLTEVLTEARRIAPDADPFALGFFIGTTGRPAPGSGPFGGT